MGLNESHSENEMIYWYPKQAHPTENRNFFGHDVIMHESYLSGDSVRNNGSGTFTDRNLLKRLNVFSLIVCGRVKEMPGQLGDPGEISGAKGTADVTVSGPRTLPLSPHLLQADRKMPSEEFGSKTR